MTKALFPSSINIVEVGPRDGLQNEAPVPTQAKIELINQLSLSGLTHIEAGSFVSPKWVPQMADSQQVLTQITRHVDVCYSALTPNVQGLELALQSNVDQVAIFTSVSESFCQHNINCSIEDSLERFSPVIKLAKQNGRPIRGYLSCVLDCPYEGETSPQRVKEVTKRLLDLGCYQVSLGDTVGTGTPLRVESMLKEVLSIAQPEQIAVHFHNTWGQALANVYQALRMGIHTVDSSVAGLGGCPYANGASGNVATEEILYLCQGLGIETGADLERVARAGWQICRQLNKSPTSNVSIALQSQLKL
ncbi:hydroxymethylglutaryl-CoA lyase [Vibrio atypicus]|uniref:hydroxymethylglutaryl-CoA lyase n=1 Tax=Vibrio atypicus TaxID=558271 RepID=UPI0013582481|nr:hydroxymethylglutaryl-CoA lyase [Vibrio atypicus]